MTQIGCCLLITQFLFAGDGIMGSNHHDAIHVVHLQHRIWCRGIRSRSDRGAVLIIFRRSVLLSGIGLCGSLASHGTFDGRPQRLQGPNGLCMETSSSRSWSGSVDHVCVFLIFGDRNSADVQSIWIICSSRDWSQLSDGDHLISVFHHHLGTLCSTMGAPSGRMDESQ